MNRRTEIHGREWCYVGPATATDVMREAADNDAVSEPTQYAPEHLPPELTSCLFRALRSDDGLEAAWLADQWRLTDEDRAYERGGSQEVSEP